VIPIGQRASYRRTFAVLCVGALGFALLQSMVAPVLPLLQTELHTSQTTVTWVLTAYLLSAAVCTPILGRIGDMLGKKRVLVATLVVLAAGTVLAAIATSIGLMITGRAIQGVGGGLIPLSFGIIRDEFPRQKVASAVGAVAALLAVGGGIGVTLAGPIVKALDYHWLFWTPGVVVIAAAITTQLFVPESANRTRGRISWGAAVLLSAWLVALLVAVSEAPSWGWGSSRVIALLAASIVLVTAWIWVELHSSQPLIDMRMMRRPAVWTTNLVAFMFGAGMYSTFAFIPIFLETPTSYGYGFGASVTEAGLIILPMSITTFIFGTLSGPLAARFGAKAVVIAGSLLSIPTFGGLAIAHDEIWQVVTALSVGGVGFGLAYAAMATIIVDSVPSRQTGVAVGMNSNIRTLGGAIGAAVTASVVTSMLAANGVPKEAGYTAGFLLLTATSVIAVGAAFVIPNITSSRDLHQQEQAAMVHAELALVAGGTIVGDDPE
jgi:EmrB/QacA subfamily drug resistance transporter